MIKKLLLTAVLAVFSAQAVVQAGQIDGSDPEEILNVVKGYGSAELETDDAGDPMISGRMEGEQFVIWFYDCEEGKNCQTISFSAAWTNSGSADVDLMNKWNQEKRFVRAYLDSEGDPAIDWDVNLTYGVSAENLDDTVGVWSQMLAEFSDFLDEAE